MDEEIERLIVSVRADTRAFASDVGEMRAVLEGPFAAGAVSAGRRIEDALIKAVRTGRFGFEELRGVAMKVMDDIAASAIRTGLGSLFGGGGIAGGLLGAVSGLLGGSPGRATGGAVSPGRPYWVGERGPELFVPGSAGQVAAPMALGRDVRVSITVNAAPDAAPRALAQSGRQVARAVKAALAQVE